MSVEAGRLFNEHRDRIYRQTDRHWDGTWQLVFVTPPHDRAARIRLRADLAFMGYAELAGDVWVSPFTRRDWGLKHAWKAAE